jgi:hypothetical protein
MLLATWQAALLLCKLRREAVSCEEEEEEELPLVTQKQAEEATIV